MQVSIQSPHITMNEKQEEFILKKLNHLDKVFKHIESCQVVFKKEKSDVKSSILVEVKVAVPGNDLFARDASASFEQAVDKVCTNLEGQLKRRKEKLDARNRQPKLIVPENDLDF